VKEAKALRDETPLSLVNLHVLGYKKIQAEIKAAYSFVVFMRLLVSQLDF
jgi:hypothetical protein